MANGSALLCEAETEHIAAVREVRDGGPEGAVLKRVLLVTDRSFLRPADGSAHIYLMWLHFLQDLGCRVSVLSFNRHSVRWREEEVAFLRAQGCDVLVVNAFSSIWQATALQLLGLAWRTVTGHRYLPVWMQDALPSERRRRIGSFLRNERFDTVIVNKLHTTHLVGRSLLAALSARKLVDIHDNFPLRIVLMRRVVLRMLCRRRLRRHLKLRELLDVLNWASLQRMLAEEVEMLSCYDYAIFYAPEEAATFTRVGLPLEKVCIVPVPRGAEALADSGSEPRPYQIGLIAGAALFNIEGAEFLARFVLPLLHGRNVRLLIVGAICDAIADLVTRDCTTLIKWIDDVGDFYRQVEVVLVPLLSGTGISIKAVEAAACGAAIVTTSIGCRGLELEPGRDLLVADTAESFAAAIIRLLDDPALRRTLRANAARSVRVNHARDIFVERVRDLL